MRETHQDAFKKFDVTFPEEVTNTWGKEVAAWDADHAQPNPYVEPAQGTSLAALKLQLAEEEAADAARGILRSQEKSATAFLCHALDIEDEQ